MDTKNEAIPGWKLLKKANLKTKWLLRAKAELHQAIQFAAAVGRSYSPHSGEDRFGSLTWDDHNKMPVSVVVGKGQRIYAGLGLSKHTLYIYREDGNLIDKLPLKGLLRAEIVDWLKKKLGTAGFDQGSFTLELPYDIPEYDHGFEKKIKFKRKKTFAEFSRLFENASLVLRHYQHIHRKYSGEIKCWPHHFDIAFQLIYSKDDKPGNKYYVGLGFSPGDEKYKRPYYYINLWPVPGMPFQELPPIGEGNWNTEGWFGATLDLKSLKKIKGAGEQAQLVKGFYDSTLRETLKIINVGE